MRRYFDVEILPGQDARTDDQILEFIRSQGVSSYHVCGTCKMGADSDPYAVVDDQLRVYGAENLHVVDTSIMPRTPSGNTCAPVLMVAEKAADLLLGRAPLAAAEL